MCEDFACENKIKVLLTIFLNKLLQNGEVTFSKQKNNFWKVGYYNFHYVHTN